MNEIKILHLVSDLNPINGGVGQAVRTLSAGLSNFRIKNIAISLDSPAAKYNDSNSLTVLAKGPRKGPWSYSPKLLPFLADQLKYYDVVIVHGIWLYHSYAIRTAFKMLKRCLGDEGDPKKIPLLFIMPHGMLDPYFQQASGRKFKAIRNWFYWKLIENKLIKESDGLLFTCDM